MSDNSIAEDLDRNLTTLIVNETLQPPPNLDVTLNKADSQTRLNEDIFPWRPMDVQEHPTAAFGVPLERLALRSQPVPSQTQEFETIDSGGEYSEHYDRSGIFLNRDMKFTFGIDSPVYARWRSQLARHVDELNMNVQIPTMLDTIAVLPPPDWSQAVGNFYSLFATLLETFHAAKNAIWPSGVVEDILKDCLTRCNI